MSKSTMKTVTFQHLDTHPIGGSSLWLFGRQMDGKSVAVKVSGIKPHFVIKIDPDIEPSIWIEQLRKDVDLYRKSKSILFTENDDNIKMVKTIKPDDNLNTLLTYDVIDGQDITNYNEDGPCTFLRIKCRDNYVCNATKKYLSTEEVNMVSKQYYFDGTYKTPITGKICSKYHSIHGKLVIEVIAKLTLGKFQLYNDHVNFTLQWLVDNDIMSCSFLEVTGVERNKETSCNIELDMVSIKQIKKDKIAPWRVLSYDIESVPRPIPGKRDKYLFPTAWKDPICTIGGTLQIGSEIELYVWILNAPAGSPDRTPFDKLQPLENPPDEYKPEDTKIFHFDNELKMIKHFIAFIIEKDIDFLEGHNINRFDNTYVLDRYSCLMNYGIRPIEEKRELPVLGRIKHEKSQIKISIFQSNQKGAHEKFKLHFPGRIVLDSYDIMKDQHNESSYKLDSLAAKYLGTKKIAQDYNDIYPMWHSQKGRHDLAVYCVKDSWLVRKMMDKLCKLTVFLQMSNVTGISMKDVIERGQGIRTIGLMLRYAKRRTPEYFIPKIIKEVKRIKKRRFNMKTNKIEIIEENAPPESFEGAVVVEPKKGFYKDAVSCLDFASLYPSIMRALNMSYETLVSAETVERMGWKELEGKEEAVGVRTIPDYDYTNMKLTTVMNRKNPIFVSATTRKGLMCEMLESVLAERKVVKKMMKALNDPSCDMYKVYDGRQLGLKVVANSMYGFTGAVNGFLPEKRIASSVTKYGRYMITQTKSKVENHPVWGKEHGCRCIYGDTDSVFVHMPRSLVDGKDELELMTNAHKMGEEMANYVTNIFLPPNELEYEKSYSSFLLLRKKRYAGHKYEPGHKPKLQIKGLEAARRDYAPLLVKTQKKMLDILLLERDIQKACNYVSGVVHDLNNNKIPLELLVMSKKLSRAPEDYKATAAHVNLALRLAKEKPETAPVSGDRVDFIIYNSGSDKVSESACLPSEIESGKYTIDTSYYMEKQLKGPLLRILERVVDKPKELFTCQSIFKPSCSSGIMATFLNRKTIVREKTNKPVMKKRKHKEKKPTVQQTLEMIFGKKKS